MEGGDSYGITECDAFYYCGDGLLVSTSEYELAWGGTCQRECDSSFYGLDFVTCTSSTNSTITMLTTKYEAILEGCTHACDGGMVVIRGGSTASAQGGPVHIYGRDSLSGSENAQGGLIEIRSGASTSDGGAIDMITGHSTGTASGALKVGSGVGTSSATSGTVDVFSGTTCTGDSGAVTVNTGAAETGTAGNLNLKIGDSGTGAGGDIILEAGDTTGDGAVGGDVWLYGGNGGNSTYSAGGVGGAITILGGTGATGTTAAIGGSVSINGGEGASGAVNGDVNIGLTSYAVTIGPVDHTKAVTVNGLLDANTLRIGGGAIISKHQSMVSGSEDPPLLQPAQSWYQDFGVAGATLGDIVMVSFDQSLGDTGAQLTASVLQSGWVRVVIYNPGVGAGTLDLAAGIFRFTVIQYS
jgi:hypothetical protein